MEVDAVKIITDNPFNLKDLETHCFLCLSGSDPVFDVFSADPRFHLVDPKIFLEITQIEVGEAQGRNVCQCCIYFINLGCEFQKQIRLSRRILSSGPFYSTAEDFDKLKECRKELGTLYDLIQQAKEAREAPVEEKCVMEESIKIDNATEKTDEGEGRNSMSVDDDSVDSAEGPFSSEDEISLSVQREKLLKQKPKRKNLKAVTKSMLTRTVETQDGVQNDQPTLTSIHTNGDKRPRKNSIERGRVKSTGRHACKTCDCVFTSESELLVHIFSDHRRNKLNYLDDATEMLAKNRLNNGDNSKETLLAVEVTDKKAVGGDEQCDECDEQLANESELLMHKFTEHLRRRVRTQHTARCPDCEVTLPGTKSLYQHIRQKHSFRCPDCHDGFASAELMERHLTELGPHKEHFVCQDCGVTFDDRRKLKEHMRKKVKCDVCNKVFSSSQRLVEHKVIKHNIGTKKEYQCEICGKGFPYYSSLRYHKRTHGEKNIVCPICGKTFHFVCNYNVHVNLHHSTAEDNVVCDVCGEMVPKHKMRNHVTRHAQPSLPCDLCGKMFRFKGQLKRHKVRFHKDTPHPCPFCRKGFVKAENLKAHVTRVHEHMHKRAQH